MPTVSLLSLRQTFLTFTLALALLGCGDDTRPNSDSGLQDAGGDVAADTGAEDSALAEVPFTVVTWNVENLFDTRNDPDTPGDEVLSASELLDKLMGIGAVLRQIDADFIALQEVETQALLERLNNEQLSEMGYQHVGLMDGFDGRGIDVGYISRFPVTNVVSHIGERFETPAGEQARFARDALEVFLDVQGYEVLVMVTHFISQIEDNDDRRIGEATYARDLLRRRLIASDRLIFAGDVNDTPESATYDALTPNADIVDLTRRVPESDRWTFVFRGRNQQLDYIMASQRMVRDLDNVEIVRSASVDGSSDHNPVTATFTLRP